MILFTFDVMQIKPSDVPKACLSLFSVKLYKTSNFFKRHHKLQRNGVMLSKLYIQYIHMDVHIHIQDLNTKTHNPSLKIQINHGLHIANSEFFICMQFHILHHVPPERANVTSLMAVFFSAIPELNCTNHLLRLWVQ